MFVLNEEYRCIIYFYYNNFTETSLIKAISNETSLTQIKAVEMRIIWQTLEQLDLIKKSNNKNTLLSPSYFLKFLVYENEMASINLRKGDKLKLSTDAKEFLQQL